jgi:hypothetical protein
MRCVFPVCGLLLALITPAAIAQEAGGTRDAEIAALKEQLAILAARLQSLEQRADAQSEVNIEQAKANEAHADVAALKQLVNDTKLSGRMYYNLSNIEDSSKGVKTDKSGFAFDIKRFYLGVDHAFDDNWSINLTTDFQYAASISATELFIKKAYVQYRHSDALVLRAGSADTPFVPLAETWNGYRWIEPTTADRLKFASSADWGVHASGELVGGAVGYAASAVNGNGFRNPSRSKGLDFEARLNYLPTGNTVLAVSGYTGTRGQERTTADALHNAERLDFLAAYAAGNTRLGVQYFRARNWNNVVTVASDTASGYSLWGSVGLTDGGITLFGRYDNTGLSETLDPSLRDVYYNLGVEWPVIKGVKLATVYKHTDQSNDAKTRDLQTDEVGVWGEVRF